MNEENGGWYGWRLFWGLWIVALLLISYFKYPEVRNLADQAYQALISGDEELLQDWLGQLGAWGPVAIVITMTVQMFLLVVPSIVLIVVSVVSYGPLWGLLLIVASVIVASTIGYCIGSLLSRITVKKIVGHEKEEKLERYVDRYGLWVIVITRLSPLFSSDAVSFVSGLLNMNYWKFMAATLAGIIPLTGLVAFFGSGNRHLEYGLTIISIVSVIGLAVYIYFDRRRFNKE
ncbi:MAG: TVP38/TMEM64 family protein [Thermodesulfobacteriota bacterium]